MIPSRSATNYDVISMWYHDRAREIERLSGEVGLQCVILVLMLVRQVLNSLTLIEIAKDYGIKVLITPYLFE